MKDGRYWNWATDYKIRTSNTDRGKKVVYSPKRSELLLRPNQPRIQGDLLWDKGSGSECDQSPLSSAQVPVWCGQGQLLLSYCMTLWGGLWAQCWGEYLDLKREDGFPLWSKLWRAIGCVSVMQPAMGSYKKCLRFGESYGELQKVSPLWRRLWRVIEVSVFWRKPWRATESVSVMEKAMESYRKCLEKGMERYRKCIRYEESYGEL
jgi:hypothetical protein